MRKRVKEKTEEEVSCFWYDVAMRYPEILRRATSVATAGDVKIGSGHPVVIQSMTNTPTADAAATIAQVRRLAEAGAQLVRVATPTPADTAALAQIVAESPVGIVADVHFHFERALEAIADLAVLRKTGARGLRSILEGIMRDTMFEIPSQDDVRQVIITRETVESHTDPEVVLGDPPNEIKEA